MSYILDNKDYMSFKNDFRSVVSIDSSNGANIGKVWSEFLSSERAHLVPYVKGFVSRGSNVYILVDKSHKSGFNFGTWVRSYGGSGVNALNFVSVFGAGVLPRPIEGVLEELRDLSYGLRGTAPSPRPASRASVPSEESPAYGGTVLVPEGLFALSGGRYSFSLDDVDETYTLGSGGSSDFIVQERGVSRSHLLVRMKRGILSIKDNNSTNGTKVNGRRISSQHWVEVEDGDQIKIGTLVLSVSALEEEM